MNIPNIVITKNNLVPTHTVNFIQKFAKDLIKASLIKNNKKYKGIINHTLTAKDCEVPKLLKFQMKEKIYDWFFNLDIDTQIIICSIQNKWLVDIFYQLYLEWKNKVVFQITPYMIESIKIIEEYNKITKSNCQKNLIKNIIDPTLSNTFFIPVSVKFNLNILEQMIQKLETLLVNSIRFTSTYEYNDTIILNREFIENKDTFKISMENFTCGDFLKQWILPIYNEENKNYIFPFSNWANQLLLLSFPNIIIMYIEQNILLHYEYYYYSNTLYELPYAGKIRELLNDNLKLEKFIERECQKGSEYFISKINFDDIFNEFSQCRKKKEIINKYECIRNRINNKNCTILNDEKKILFIEKKKDFINTINNSINSSIKNFIYNLTIVTSECVFKEEDFIGKKIYEYILDMMKIEETKDLITQLQLEDNNDKKKKKKNKKKIKKDNNNKENIIIEEKKEIKEDKDSINNQCKEKDKVKEIKECNSIQEEERKKNKKGFYLFPVQTKKEKKKKEQNTIKDSTPTQSDTSSSSTQKDNNETFRYPHLFTLLYPPHNFHPQNLIFTHQKDNIYYCEQSILFFSKLSRDIISYAKSVESNMDILTSTRLPFLNNLKKNITDSLCNEYDLEIILYGSFSTGLNIESSDIDILIQYKEKYPNQRENDININIKSELILIRKFFSFLNKNHNNNFDYINPILSASVPVLKLQQDISKELYESIKSQYIFKHYMFNKEDLIKIKFDITFNEKNESMLNVSHRDTVKFVTNAIEEYPEIKPIFILLKRYMKIQKMNNSFQGGLSSYSLFLLIFAFIKIERRNIYQMQMEEYGLELYNFFQWYANFDFKKYIIKPGVDNPFIFINEYQSEHIIILDPLTNLNVSHSSFKIEQIKETFKKGLNLLQTAFCQMVNQPFSINIVHKLLLEI